MFTINHYALAIALLAGAAQAQAATQYRFTDLAGWSAIYSTAGAINDKGTVAGSIGNYEEQVAYGSGVLTLWSGGKQTVLDSQHTGQLNAINAAGDVAGFANVDGHRHAAVWSNGAVTDLAAKNGFTAESAANAINNGGRAVGYADVSQSWDEMRYHAISWDKNGKATDLNALSGPAFTSSGAYGINNKGDIVGDGLVDGQWRPVLWSNGQASTLGAMSGTAYGINDNGQVIGQTYGSRQHAFTWANGQAVDLGTLGGASSGANAINSRGDIVGWADTPYHNDHAVLWTNGQMIDLNAYAPSEWVIRSAIGINDQGVIVGYAEDWTGISGVRRAFMLTPVAPVPEAETYAMMLGGFALFGLMRRRVRTRQAA